MTWKSLAGHLLQRASFPALVIDARGRIQMVNWWLELATGRREAEIEKRSFVHELVAPEAREEASCQMEAILAGDLDALRTRIGRWDGKPLDAVMTATTIDAPGTRLVVLEGELREPHLEVPEVPGMEVYEICSTGDAFGELRFRWPGGTAGEMCFTSRYDRARPCPHCPARELRPGERARTGVIRMTGEAWYDLVTARYVGPTVARVGVMRVTEDALSELLETRILRMAEEHELSERERVVLHLLLLGRSLREIGETLKISIRTVKFHQTNVLRKLGAQSRMDLLRVLL